MCAFKITFLLLKKKSNFRSVRRMSRVCKWILFLIRSHLVIFNRHYNGKRKVTLFVASIFFRGLARNSLDCWCSAFPMSEADDGLKMVLYRLIKDSRKGSFLSLLQSPFLGLQNNFLTFFKSPSKELIRNSDRRPRASAKPGSMVIGINIKALTNDLL